MVHLSQIFSDSLNTFDSQAGLVHHKAASLILYHAENSHQLRGAEQIHQFHTGRNFRIRFISRIRLANDFGWRVEAPWDDVGLAAHRHSAASQHISEGSACCTGTIINCFSHESLHPDPKVIVKSAGEVQEARS